MTKETGFELEIDTKAVTAEGEFEGYASVFGNEDYGRDIMVAGAFTKSLARRPAGKVKLLRQHYTDEPIGIWTDLVEDSRGLKGRGKLTRPATGSAYGQVEIPVDEIACYVDVSNKLLEDSAVDVNGEVAFDLAEEFGRLEGVAFVSGDGVKKPLGFMSDTNVAHSISGSVSAISDTDGGIDGLIDLLYAMHPFYRSRGVWMANGTTIGKLRKLKDADKNYIWQASALRYSFERTVRCRVQTVRCRVRTVLKDGPRNDFWHSL